MGKHATMLPDTAARHVPVNWNTFSVTLQFTYVMRAFPQKAAALTSDGTNLA
jgi:hypothetical protein